MRIAICDDESAPRASIRKSAENCGLPTNTIEIAEFSNGHALLKSHRENPFDVIFLDIQMDGLSGVETGHIIRNADKNAIIIFITGYEQYVYQSFKIEAFDYILKPINHEKIKEALLRAAQKYRDTHHLILCNWQNTAHTIDVGEIVYVEGYDRHVKFFTGTKEYECVGKLNDYETTLAPYGFSRCHQGFLINMSYIKSIEKDTITTKYNHTVPMSIRKKRDCLRAFNLFVAKYRV